MEEASSMMEVAAASGVSPERTLPSGPTSSKSKELTGDREATVCREMGRSASGARLEILDVLGVEFKQDEAAAEAAEEVPGAEEDGTRKFTH